MACIPPCSRPIAVLRAVRCTGAAAKMLGRFGRPLLFQGGVRVSNSHTAIHAGCVPEAIVRLRWPVRHFKPSCVLSVSRAQPRLSERALSASPHSARRSGRQMSAWRSADVGVAQQHRGHGEGTEKICVERVHAWTPSCATTPSQRVMSEEVPVSDSFQRQQEFNQNASSSLRTPRRSASILSVGERRRRRMRLEPCGERCIERRDACSACSAWVRRAGSGMAGCRQGLIPPPHTPLCQARERQITPRPYPPTYMFERDPTVPYPAHIAQEVTTAISIIPSVV